MFQIAICDDNIADLSNMASIIEEYKDLRRDKLIVKYTAFHSAVDLIAAMESGQHYDLVLLDILMPFVTGMDAAKEIRQFNKNVKIIFATSSTEFAVESYSVDAYYYALKPLWKDQLIILLDTVISEMEIHKGTSFMVKSKTGLTRVFLHRLEFAEVIGRSIHYHLTDGSVIEAFGSMSVLEKELLSHTCFIKPHRSYMINIDHINTLSKKEIIMQSNALVPMAKANFHNVKSAYITFSFNNIQNYDNV